MSENLGYEKRSADGDKSSNSRSGEFEPEVVRKYETTTNDLEDKIINIYALGLSTRDIEKNIQVIYGVEVCNDLKNRGFKDILIACKDRLIGFSEAINDVFPKTELKLCVINQIRNSLKYYPIRIRKR